MATLIHALCASSPTKVVTSIVGSFRMRLWRFTRQSAVCDGRWPSLSLLPRATLRLEPAFSCPLAVRRDLTAFVFAATSASEEHRRAAAIPAENSSTMAAPTFTA